MEDNVISVDFGDQIVRYRNHEPERLLEIVGIGGTVRVFSSLLQSWSDYCFSIVDADAQWIPCDNEPLRSTTRGIDMTQPILLAPVTRAIAQLISEWADDFDSWPLEDDEIDLIAYNIANELSAQPDPSDPRRWWITLPSDDETLH